MIKRALTILFTFLVIYCLFYLFTYNSQYDRGPDPSFSSVSLKGQTLNPITFIDTKNIKRTLFNDDQLTIVVFWASWCSPCMAELPYFIQLYNQYSDKGLTIVGFSLDYTEDDLVNTIKEYKVPFPNMMMTPEISNAFGGVYSIPFTVIVKGNTIVDSVLGYSEPTYFNSFLNSKYLP